MIKKHYYDNHNNSISIKKTINPKYLTIGILMFLVAIIIVVSAIYSIKPKKVTLTSRNIENYFIYTSNCSAATSTGGNNYTTLFSYEIVPIGDYAQNTSSSDTIEIEIGLIINGRSKSFELTLYKINGYTISGSEIFEFTAVGLWSHSTYLKVISGYIYD